MDITIDSILANIGLSQNSDDDNNYNTEPETSVTPSSSYIQTGTEILSAIKTGLTRAAEDKLELYAEDVVVFNQSLEDQVAHLEKIENLFYKKTDDAVDISLTHMLDSVLGIYPKAFEAVVEHHINEASVEPDAALSYSYYNDPVFSTALSGAVFSQMFVGVMMSGGTIVDAVLNYSLAPVTFVQNQFLEPEVKFTIGEQGVEAIESYSVDVLETAFVFPAISYYLSEALLNPTVTKLEDIDGLDLVSYSYYQAFKNGPGDLLGYEHGKHPIINFSRAFSNGFSFGFGWGLTRGRVSPAQTKKTFVDTSAPKPAPPRAFAPRVPTFVENLRALWEDINADTVRPTAPRDDYHARAHAENSNP